MFIPTTPGANHAAHLQQFTDQPQWAAAIHAAVPKVSALAEQADRLKGLAASIPQPVTDVRAAVLAALDSDEVPDLVQVVTQARDATVRHTAAQAELSDLWLSLQAERHALVSDHATTILESMTHTVAGLVTAYRANKAVAAGVRTAEQAISTGLTKAWPEVGELEDRWASVMGLRTGFLRHFCGAQLGGTRTLPELDVLANPEQVNPDLVTNLAEGNYDHAGRPLGCTWPTAALHDPEWLRWFADTPEATVWLPTPEQAEDRREQINAQVRALRRTSRR